MIHMIEGDVPAWYRFGLNHTIFSVVIRDVAYQHLERELGESNRLIPLLQEGLSLPPFVRLPQERWGFGGLIETARASGGWTTVICPVPRRPDTTELYTFSANLNLLLTSLRYFEGAVENTGEVQLMAIDALGTAQVPHGCGIRLTISSTLADWLQTQEQGSQTHIQTAMSDVTTQIVGKREVLRQFRAELYEGRWLNFEVPGQCACLGRDGSLADQPGPYELFSHNVDTPLQQIALMAGIAAVCSAAHRSLFGRK